MIDLTVCARVQDTLPSPFITLSSRHVCQLQDKEVFDFVGLLSYVGDPHVVSHAHPAQADTIIPASKAVRV